MRRLVLPLVLASCGTFEPVIEAGPATVSGCVVRGDGAKAADVPVFVLENGSPIAESRTDATGCFSVSVSTGRRTLLVHDFRGEGTIEPVRLYSGQRLSLPTRTLHSLALDPTMPTFRGVGSGESLGRFAGVPAALSCDRLESTLRLTTGLSSQRIDAETGERTDGEPVVQVTARNAPAGTYDLQRGGAPVLPDGAFWYALSFNEYAFVGELGRAREANPNSVGEDLGAWYGTRNALVRIDERCQLLPNGSCLRTKIVPGGFEIERHRPDAPADQWLLHTTGTLAEAVYSRDGTEGVLVLNETDAVSMWRVTPQESLMLLRVPHARLTPLGLAPTDRPTFRIEAANGTGLWVQVTIHTGQLETLPFPPLREGEVLLENDESGSAYPEVVRTVRRKSEDAWEFRILEHLGATTRTRTLEVPLLRRANYGSVDSRITDSQYLPALHLIPAGEGALEALGIDTSLRVLRRGQPLEDARPVATLGLSTYPVCIAGRSLLATAYVADFSLEAMRYDIARIADELARSP